MSLPTIGIIGGKGKMGQLFASFFKDRGIKVLISDINTKLSNSELAQKSDITIISVPIDKTEKIIQTILPEIPKDSAIMDLTSVKQMPIKQMLKGNCEVLGMHPMFGNSNPLRNQTIILTPTKKSGKWTLWIEKFFKENSVQIEKMSPKEHDKLMCVCQGLIHFADIAFMDGIRKSKIKTDLLGKFSSKASMIKVILAARLIAQDSNLYANIQIQNPATIKILKKYQSSLNKLIKIVEQKDLKSFEKYFRKNYKKFEKFAKESFKESTFLIEKHLEYNEKKRPANQQIPRKNDLAILGPKNTFSDQAGSKYIEEKKSEFRKFYTKNIYQIFDLVEKGKVDTGIAPIENSIQGTVRESLEELFTKEVHIIDEIQIPIHHCLITHQQSQPKNIKKIISHSQALSQCREFLNKKYPNVDLEEAFSTAQAVESVAKNNLISVAAIGSEFAAKNYGLKILEKNIEDISNNVTKFLVIKRGKINKKNKPKHLKNITSIVFYFDKNKPGGLFSVMKEFAEAKIDLSRIESRPARIQFGEYIFFIDFTGNIWDPNVSKTLQKVEKKVANLKILGSY